MITKNVAKHGYLPNITRILRRTQCDISIPPQLIQDAINGTIVNLGSAENSRWNELRQNSFQIWSTPRIPANSPLNLVETLEILSLKESFLFKNCTNCLYGKTRRRRWRKCEECFCSQAEVYFLNISYLFDQNFLLLEFSAHMPQKELEFV